MCQWSIDMLMLGGTVSSWVLVSWWWWS